MDGRCVSVFAAAAAIGASFYVFSAPDGNKKKAPKRGECYFFLFKTKNTPKQTNVNLQIIDMNNDLLSVPVHTKLTSFGQGDQEHLISAFIMKQKIND